MSTGGDGAAAGDEGAEGESLAGGGDVGVGPVVVCGVLGDPPCFDETAAGPVWR
jgi:hypothetical protein